MARRILQAGPGLLAALMTTAAPISAGIGPAVWPTAAMAAPSAAMAYCAAEREPFVTLQKQYDSEGRDRMGKSIGAGLLAGGAALLASGVINKAQGKSFAPNTLEGVAIVGVALFASVETYMKLKAQGAQNRRQLAMAIDADAGQQLGTGRATLQQARLLTACRARQVEDFKARQAQAPDPKKMKREQDQIADAVKQDIALTDKIVGRQAELAKTLTQARAMAEGRSEAQVLADQRPAYAGQAGAQALQPPSSLQLADNTPPPVAAGGRTVVTTVRATPVRAAPSAKAKVLATLPARSEVTPSTEVQAVQGWTPVQVNGATGYAREVNLASSGPRPVPGALAPAGNVREYNKVVLESRDEGPDRMRNLLTNFQ